MSVLTSDWAGIFGVILGFVITIAVAWYFFRQQQQTDFNKLKEILSTTSERIASIETSINIKDDIGRNYDISLRLRDVSNDLDELRRETNGLAQRIIDDVRHQQDKLISEAREQVAQQISKSQPDLVSALERVFSDRIEPGLEQKTLAEVRDLFEHALAAWGKAQTEMLTASLSNAMHEVEKSTDTGFTALSKNVDELSEKVDSAIALPSRAA